MGRAVVKTCRMIIYQELEDVHVSATTKTSCTLLKSGWNNKCETLTKRQKAHLEKKHVTNCVIGLGN